MAGVTREGFEAKRLADVLSDGQAQLATIIDPATGQTLQPDFASSDPAMQVVKVPLDGVATAWEALALVFEQFDPNKAVGASLSALVQLNGISRQPAVASTVTLTLTGTPSALIPAGTLIGNAANTSQWATDNAVAIGLGGTVTVEATCTVIGPVEAGAGTLTNIVTPVAGLTAVTNIAAANIGRDEETDTDLRLRRQRSTLAPSASPVESVYGNLANLPGVTFARVYVNNTLSPDGRGIPGKSVAAVVVGGSDDDIAFELLARTGVTASWFGTTSKTLSDAQGTAYVIRWTRPTPVPIYVALNITVTDATAFPSDGPARIKQAIVDYSVGGAAAVGAVDGFDQIGFPPGSLVVRSQLFTAINSIPGHTVNSLFIGLTPSPVGTADIQIDFDKYPQFTVGNIDVTVVP